MVLIHTPRRSRGFRLYYIRFSVFGFRSSCRHAYECETTKLQDSEFRREFRMFFITRIDADRAKKNQ